MDFNRNERILAAPLDISVAPDGGTMLVLYEDAIIRMMNLRGEESETYELPEIDSAVPVWDGDYHVRMSVDWNQRLISVPHDDGSIVVWSSIILELTTQLSCASVQQAGLTNTFASARRVPVALAQDPSQVLP